MNDGHCPYGDGYCPKVLRLEEEVDGMKEDVDGKIEYIYSRMDRMCYVLYFIAGVISIELGVTII